MGELLYFYLYLLLFFFIASSPLVGAQIVMTRLYGWKGLVSTTAVLIFLVLGGPAIVSALGLVELTVLFWDLMPLSVLVPLFIVLTAFLVLARSYRRN